MRTETSTILGGEPRFAASAQGEILGYTYRRPSEHLPGRGEYLAEGAEEAVPAGRAIVVSYGVSSVRYVFVHGGTLCGPLVWREDDSWTPSGPRDLSGVVDGNISLKHLAAAPALLIAFAVAAPIWMLGEHVFREFGMLAAFPVLALAFLIWVRSGSWALSRICGVMFYRKYLRPGASKSNLRALVPAPEWGPEGLSG